MREPGSHIDYGPVFAEYSLGNNSAKYMIRNGDFKYTYWVDDLPELYDLRNDPQELYNLASDPAYQSTVKRLKEELFAWHRPTDINTR